MMGPVVVIVSGGTEYVCEDGKVLVPSTASIISKMSGAWESACLPSNT